MRKLSCLFLFATLTACGTNQPDSNLADNPNGVNESLTGTQRISACTQNATVTTNTLNGYACYADQEVVSIGVLNWVAKPIRYAHIEVLRNSDDLIQLTTTTDASGFYSMNMTTLAAGTDYRVRVITSGTLSSSDTHVVDDGNYLYALASSTFQKDGGGLAFNLVAASDVVGQAFNVFDQMVKGQHYLLDVAGVPSVAAMDAIWYPGNASGTFFCSRDFASYPISECPTGPAMHVLGEATDSDGYDDSVILHEYGHFVMEYFSRDDSPGGVHYLTQTDQDLRLSWSEGFATAFATLAQQYAGDANPDRYLDSDGLGNFFIEYYVEGPIGGANVFSPKTRAYGMANEVAITVALWDIADNSGATESFDSISEESNLWAAILSLNAVTSGVTFQNFWETWAGSSLQTLVEDRHIYMLPDTYESDNSRDTAKPIAIDSVNWQQHTLHTATDEDWVSVYLTAGANYAVATSELLSGAKVLLSLYDSGGVLVTAAGLTNPANYITFSPSSSGTYYIQVSRDPTSSTYARYGSYKLQVKTY